MLAYSRTTDDALAVLRPAPKGVRAKLRWMTSKILESVYTALRFSPNPATICAANQDRVVILNRP